MAFSKSVPKGQTPLGCQLCDGGNKIEWKCIECNLLMCVRCKDRVHSRIAKDHRIVNTKKIGEHGHSWESFVFGDLKCQDHQNHPCSLYCKTCSKVICLKCIVKAHNGHTFVDEEELDDKKKELKEGQKKVQSHLGKLSAKKEKTSSPEKTETQKLKQIEQNILERKKTVIKAVEQYADNIFQDVDQHFKTLKKVEKNKIDERIKDMHEKNEALESIITSRDFMQFFRDFDRLKVALNEDMPQETLNISFFANFVPGQFTRLNFGTLEGSKKFLGHHSKVELKVTNQWTTELININFMLSCTDGTLWIADNLNFLLQQIKLKKDVLKVLSSFNIDVYGLDEISPSNVIVSTGENRLKLINGKTQKITDSVFDVAPFISRAVHITKDKKVIVTARNTGNTFPVTGRRIVIVMDQEGNRLIEYDNDNKDTPYFILPLTAISTNHGNICVGDRLDDDCRGRVVVIDQDGNTKAIYTGHDDVNTEASAFMPSGLVATISDNIVVTDWQNNLIHILNSDGDFISYHNVHDIGIEYPQSLALSIPGNLFIGCTSYLDHPKTFRAKLYDVQYSGF